MQISKKIKVENLFSVENRRYSKIRKPKFTVEKPLSAAIEFSKSNGMLPVFSKDICIKGAKKFFVCSYDRMERILKSSELEKHYYEIIQDGIACNLYIDIDIDLSVNNINKAEIEKLINELISNMKNFMIELSYATEFDDITFLCLDSTTDIKFSRHYIIKTKKGWFKNVCHCGAFMRQFANYCYKLEGVSSPYNSKWWFKIKKPKKLTKIYEGGGFIIDLSVYNVNRNFRTIFSSKKGKPNAFYPFPYIDINDINVYDYFVQADCDDGLLNCKEWDGSEPISTNDVTFGRFDKVNRPMFKDLYNFYRNSFNYDYVWEMFGDPSREFAFDLETGYRRNMFFVNRESFKSYVKLKNPNSIHIGPKELVKRELIFDIDLTDFRHEGVNIRLCCEGNSKICKNCWPLLILTYEILKITLTEIFGFENIKFYFSGGKGIHCWVFDTSVLNLSEIDRNEVILFLRKDVVSKKQYFFEYIKNNEQVRKLVSLLDNSGSFRKYEDIDPLLYYWPRLDEGVTRQVNHLIKCPLSLHPGTLKLCEEINDFYTFSC